MTKTTLSIMRSSNGSESKEEKEDDTISLTVDMPDKNTRQIFTFNKHEKLWISKQLVILQLAKDAKDPLNYGFYEPPYNGRSGKFLDEERPLKDYPIRENGLYLEFKYKKRVYRSISYDEKKLTKLHTKANYRRLLDAIASNSIKQVSRMVDKGLDPNFLDDKTGESPLTWAVSRDKSPDLILALVNGGAHIDFRMANGLTPLHQAAIAGSAISIKTLLDLGASPNYRDLKGLTPLYYTTMHGGDSNCAELLLNDHAEIGITDNQGFQEIHHAAMNGLAQHVEHLLFYGADINQVTTTGKNTPLHLAALHNQDRCVRVLLCRGADRTIINGANQSPYETAVVAGNTSLGEAIRRHTESDIVPFNGKPTYSTRRRKQQWKPNLTALFTRSPSEPSSTVSSRGDSGFPPSPISSSNSVQSFHSHSSRSGSGEDSHTVEDMTDSSRKRTISETDSDSSYASDTEDSGQVSPLSTRPPINKPWASSAPDLQVKNIPPVKEVQGAATYKTRRNTDSSSSMFIAIKNNVSHQGGELQLLTGDLVEVFNYGKRGFWEGRAHGQTGWFPSDCVEKLKYLPKGGKQSARGKGVFRPSSLANLFGRNDQPPTAGVLSYSVKSDSQPDLGSQRDSLFETTVREVTLHKGKGGYGFQLRGANSRVSYLEFTPTPEFPTLQYIAEVQKGGEADLKGVKVGDFIHEVNGENVVSATHGYVVEIIKNGPDTLKLKLETVPYNKDGTIRLKLKKHQQEKEAGRFNTLSFAKPPKAPKPPPPARDPSTTLTLGRNKPLSRPPLSMKSFEQPFFDRTKSTGDINAQLPFNINAEAHGGPPSYNSYTLNRYTRATSQPNPEDEIWIPRTDSSESEFQDDFRRPKSFSFDQYSISTQSSSSDHSSWVNGEYNTLSRKHGTPDTASNGAERVSSRPRPVSCIESTMRRNWESERTLQDEKVRGPMSPSQLRPESRDVTPQKDDVVVIATPIRDDDSIRVSARPRLETDVDSLVNYDSDDEAESPKNARRSLYETDVDSIFMNYNPPEEPTEISWRPRVTDLDEAIRQREMATQRSNSFIETAIDYPATTQLSSSPTKNSDEENRHPNPPTTATTTTDTKTVFKNLLSQKLIINDNNNLLTKKPAPPEEKPAPEQKPADPTRTTGSFETREEYLHNKLESLKKRNPPKLNGILKTDSKKNQKAEKPKAVIPPPPPPPAPDMKRERAKTMNSLLADAVAQRNARVNDKPSDGAVRERMATVSTPPQPKAAAPTAMGLAACLQEINLKGQTGLKKTETPVTAPEKKPVDQNDHNSVLAQAVAARARRMAENEKNAPMNLEKKVENSVEEKGTNLVKPSDFLKQNRPTGKINELVKQNSLDNQINSQRNELLRAYSENKLNSSRAGETSPQKTQFNGRRSSPPPLDNKRTEQNRSTTTTTTTTVNSTATFTLKSPVTKLEENEQEENDKTLSRSDPEIQKSSTPKKNTSPFQFPNKVFSEEELATMLLDDVIEQEAERNNWNMSGWSDILAGPPFVRTLKCSPTSSGKSSLSTASTRSTRSSQSSNLSYSFTPFESTPEVNAPLPPRLEYVDGPAPVDENTSPGLPLPPPPSDFEDSFQEPGSPFSLPPPPMGFAQDDGPASAPSFVPSLDDRLQDANKKPPSAAEPPSSQLPKQAPPEVRQKPKPSAAPTPKPSFRTWSAAEVCQWLDTIGMGEYKESFEENEIQGVHLPDLTKPDLAELGVKRLGHRMTLVDAISKLCSNEEMTC